jgi:hypothetical protein
VAQNVVGAQLSARVERQQLSRLYPKNFHEAHLLSRMQSANSRHAGRTHYRYRSYVTTMQNQLPKSRIQPFLSFWSKLTLVLIMRISNPSVHRLRLETPEQSRVQDP